MVKHEKAVTSDLFQVEKTEVQPPTRLLLPGNAPSALPSTPVTLKGDRDLSIQVGSTKLQVSRAVGPDMAERGSLEAPHCHPLQPLQLTLLPFFHWPVRSCCRQPGG